MTTEKKFYIRLSGELHMEYLCLLRTTLKDEVYDSYTLWIKTLQR